MALFSRLVSYAWNFGRQIVNWLWAHRNVILGWLRNGLAFDVIIDKVRRYLGI
ncbi:aureocin A53 family class IId bacteriocin [[Pseudopropionibacterium] massiliense]|uniref:aureocin A53 family class IId bacteriocin n=1 Tax=[Pseudopropionibacterium] massiliense TaxID=2220000 RepID=UPI0013EF27AF|nr:aureocin A53 family class IId bacteriocin [[Pseudopropionibacterium] massiliense]